MSKTLDDSVLKGYVFRYDISFDDLCEFDFACRQMYNSQNINTNDVSVFTNPKTFRVIITEKLALGE